MLKYKSYFWVLFLIPFIGLLTACNRLVPTPGGVEMIEDPCLLPVEDQRHLSYYLKKSSRQ